MKMTKTLVAAALAAAVVAPAAQADVTLSGSVGGVIAMPLSDDATPGADLYIGSSKARINVKASEAVSDTAKVIGEIEVDYDDGSDAGADGSAIEVRTARILAVTGAGTFLIAGKTASGQQAALVGPVDIFEYGGAEFFKQVSRTPNVAAYVSPAFAGGVQVVGAVIGFGNNNDEDADALAARVVYGSDMFKAGVGIVNYPATEESRIGLGLEAGVGPATLGLAYESTTDDEGVDGADKDVLGLAVSSDFGNGFSGALGFNTVLSDDVDGQEDATAIQLLISKAMSDNVSVWGEFDTYNDEAGADDVVAFGMSLSF